MSHIETLQNNMIEIYDHITYIYSLCYVLDLLEKVNKQSEKLEGDFIEEIDRLRYKDMYI